MDKTRATGPKFARVEESVVRVIVIDLKEGIPLVSGGAVISRAHCVQTGPF